MEDQDFNKEDIIIVVHKDGDTTFIFSEDNEASVEQMKLFTRIYLCVDPSFMMLIFLYFESILTMVDIKVRESLSKFFKDED
jgi:hypothetical protein